MRRFMFDYGGKIPLKHLTHCVMFVSVIWLSIRITTRTSFVPDTVETRSYPMTLFLYILTLTPLLQLPTTMSIILGLIMYDCFPKNFESEVDKSNLAKICFRVVTKGNFQKLILKNLKRNLKVCESVNLKNFVIEIVTESDISDLTNRFNDSYVIKQVVVPHNYRTSHGTLFKARNLQYCLEDGVNVLSDHDWIVHLDEDSVLTEGAVNGVAEFISRNEHSFGVGVINSNSDGSVGILGEILEFLPLFDYGCIRFHAKFLNQFQCYVRSTFLVAKVKAEKDVSFEVEGGPSMLEDIAFGLKAHLKGYSFGSVDGCVIEQESVTALNFIEARTRALKGYFHILFKSSYFKVANCKAFTLYSLYLVSLPLTLPSVVCDSLRPVPLYDWLLCLKGLVLGVFLYGQIFIILKNHHNSVWEYACRIAVSVTLGPILFGPVWLFIYFKAILTCNNVVFFNTDKQE